LDNQHVIDLEPHRLQRDIDQLRADLNNLAHFLHQAIDSLQRQIENKVNAEPKLQP